VGWWLWVCVLGGCHEIWWRGFGWAGVGMVGLGGCHGIQWRGFEWAGVGVGLLAWVVVEAGDWRERGRLRGEFLKKKKVI
jgi:hypothetical protein